MKEQLLKPAKKSDEHKRKKLQRKIIERRNEREEGFRKGESEMIVRGEGREHYKEVREREERRKGEGMGRMNGEGEEKGRGRGGKGKGKREQ